MRTRDFIRQNRKAIDSVIRKAVKNPGYTINDEERHQWLLNEEGLYSWARRSCPGL
jgi:hypothetical protein